MPLDVENRSRLVRLGIDSERQHEEGEILTSRVVHPAELPRHKSHKLRGRKEKRARKITSGQLHNWTDEAVKCLQSPRSQHTKLRFPKVSKTKAKSRQQGNNIIRGPKH
jgi:hypothetical protein